MSISDITTVVRDVATLFLPTPPTVIEIGARVRLIGGDHVGQEAFIQNIRISPYWTEEKQGIVRIFVYAADWDSGARFTDWVMPDELEVIG